MGPDKSGAQERWERAGGGVERVQDTVTNHCQRPRPGVTAGERHLEGTAALHQAELQPSSLTGSMHVDTEDTLALVHMHTRLRTPSLAAWWGNAEIFFFFFLEVILGWEGGRRVHQNWLPKYATIFLEVTLFQLPRKSESGSRE